MVYVEEDAGRKSFSLHEKSQEDGNGNKDKHASAPIDSFGNPSITSQVKKINDLESQRLDGKLVLLGDDVKSLSMQKDANVTSVSEPNTPMKTQGEDSDSDEVEDIDDDMTRYMTNPNRVGGGTNDTSLRVYDDYDGYDDFENDVDLNVEQLAFCDECDIRIRNRARK